MTKNDDKRVPVLRFKGFNDDWAQRELRELANIGDGLHGTPTYIDNSKYFFINGNNLVNDKIRITSETKKISFSQLSKSDKALNNLTLLMSINGTIGQLAFYNGENIKLGKSIAYIIFHSKNNFEFFYGVLKTPNIQRYFQRHVTGTTIKNLGLAELRNFKYPIPSEKEQEKIGKTIILINKIIVLQQRKAKQLKLLKKAMLQDLFTDKNVPKLRFNGFDANWIQCKLEKEALLTMGQSPSGSTYSDQPSTYILVQGNADLKNGWVKPRIWTTQITKLAKKGDIIITVRAPAGKVGRTNFDVVLGRGVASIQGNDFIFYLLSKMDINKYWKKYAAGSTFESINSNDIKNTRVHVPNLSEQNRIANLFLRLDDLIRFQQNKLNNLQKTKQFLLQNMFI